jgi:hypothetical protein
MICRNTVNRIGYGRCSMPLLFGNKILTVGYDEAQIACAGLVYAGVIDFVQNAVADSEPDARGCPAIRERISNLP